MKQCRRKGNFVVRTLIFALFGILSFWYVETAVEVKAVAEKPVKSLDGNWEYLINEDGTITTTDYQGKELEVSVPLQIDGKTVRAVGERTFEGCKNMTGVAIPNGIKEIGTFAFNDCASLVDVSLPNTITEIAGFVFDDCISLVDIMIPNSVTKIGVCSFYGCSSLRSIVLPEGVTSIGNRAFSRCRELSSITIPASVITIGDLVFEGNSNSLVIYTSEGSFAEKYAKDKNIRVQIIEKPVEPTTTPIPEPTPSPGINNPTEQPPVKQPQVIQAKSYTKTYGSKAFFLNAATSGNGKLTYTVANKKIATVSSTGKVAIKGYGKTTVTIKAAKTAQYQSATKKVTITVIPKTPSVKKVFSPEKESISFSWKKDSTVTGYQIFIDSHKDFTRHHSRTFDKSKTSIVVDNARSKTKYYIKIRAYKMCGKTKYYSKWSKVKNVTVK